MASVQELEAELEALRKRQVSTKSQLCSVAKRQKVETGESHVAQLLFRAEVEQRAPNLSKTVTSQLLALLDLGGLCNDLVVSYVLGQGRQERFGDHKMDMWDAEVRRSISAGVELLYLGVPFDAVVSPVNACADEAVAALCKYVVEYRLWHWLVDLNCSKGAKPSGESMCFYT